MLLNEADRKRNFKRQIRFEGFIWTPNLGTVFTEYSLFALNLSQLLEAVGSSPLLFPKCSI